MAGLGPAHHAGRRRHRMLLARPPRAEAPRELPTRGRRGVSSTPPCGAVTVSISVAVGIGASGSPPWAATMARHTGRARPDASTSAGSSQSTPASATISRERDRDLDEVGRPTAFERLDGFGHLEPIPGRAPEHGLHRGLERQRCARRWLHRSHHRFRELAARVGIRQERAGAVLHVEHQCVRSLRDLLRHDRRRDERDRLDGAGDVAQRVELVIGRCEPRARGRDHAADIVEDCDHLVRRQSARHPGIASILSSVPPVWPRPRPESCGTAAPHAATSGTRIKRDLVADATGRVLVDGRPGHRRQVEALAALDHRRGPCGQLAAARSRARRSP